MIEKRVRGAIAVVALSWIVGACTEATPKAKQQEAAVEKAPSALSESPQVMATDADAVPTFVTGAFGSVPSEPTAINSIQADQLAPVLSRVAPLFRLAPANLHLKKAYVGFDGDAHFRYGVSHAGVEVLGAEVRLHARGGEVFSANTNARGDLTAAPATATLPPVAAVVTAREDRESPPGATVSGAPRLVYWRDEGQLVLAYEVRIRGELEDGSPVDDSVLVNAHTGEAFLRLPHVRFAMSRRVHDDEYKGALPGVLKRSEGAPPVEDALVNIAYDNMGAVYRCYKELFGRDSYDNAGADIVGSVHYLRRDYHNSGWTGSQMVFGDASPPVYLSPVVALDIVAHELTHGVTDHESHLIAWHESGGLGESMSDIFGAVCEWHSRGKVIDSGTWLIGEDSLSPDFPGGFLRRLDNPALDGSLDHYQDFVLGTWPHESAGIPSLAFYLLSQGGVHPRLPGPEPVEGIGIEKAARIFYKANVDMLIFHASFAEAKTLTEQAALQLGYGAEAARSVSAAWKAVGVGLPPPPADYPPLERDVPVTGVSGARNERRTFNVQVPEGAGNLTFTLSGGTGDADLFVRFNRAPTTSLYDCRSARAGNSEVCVMPSSYPGTWWVTVHGFSAFSDVTLKVSWTGGYWPIEPNVEVPGLSGVPGSHRGYSVQIPRRADGNPSNVHVRLHGGTGNADLYVRRSELPFPFLYDCRGLKEGTTESCDLDSFEPGKLYLSVYGAKGGYEDVSLLVSHD